LSAPTIKLSFGETLSESVEYFFRNFRLFFHLVTIPWILSIALGLLGTMLDDKSPAVLLAGKALDMLPTTMFIVAWMRIVLLGPARAGPLPGLHWSARETAFLIHLLKVAGITFLLLGAFIMAVGTLDPVSMREAAANPEVARRQALALPFGTSFIISALLALRVSFGLAASAVDVPFAPRQSWVYSRGNGWPIVGVLLLIYFSTSTTTIVTLELAFDFADVFGATLAAKIVAMTAAVFVTYVGTAIAATAQAIIFRKLTGWRDGAPTRP
jgi:hypothetical protein